MQLVPHYGDRSLIELDGPPGAIAAPTIRQRRRLVESLSRLDESGWAHASRCAGWSVRDVISHLDTTNTFWTFSIGMGLGGTPSTFLTTFDPVATPAAMVEADATSPAEVLERFAASTETFVETIGGLDDDRWTTLAEAPPGHLSVAAVTHHALWDGLVHELDVLLPLGIVPGIEDDEVHASLRYAAALGPALARGRGEDRSGRLAVSTTDAGGFTVDVAGQITVRDGADLDADVSVAGPALDLLEILSLRAPFTTAVTADHRWLLDGLATTFDASR